MSRHLGRRTTIADDLQALGFLQALQAFGEQSRAHAAGPVDPVTGRAMLLIGRRRFSGKGIYHPADGQHQPQKSHAAISESVR